jgi:hypothetical protein
MVEWYHNAIATLDIAGVGFLTWANVKVGKIHPACMVGMGLEDFSPMEIEVILAMTDPPLTGWMQHLCSKIFKKDHKGKLHFLSIDDQMVWFLHNLLPPWMVGISTIRCKWKNPNKQALALCSLEVGVIQ